MYVKLWELLRSVPLTGETPDLDMEINSISYDTRTLKPGALFAALPGARDDGARHIREALDRGAAAVLCRERPEEDGPWLVTPDPRRALALLSANWFGRPAEGLTLVGVTGTNGKTTTAFLIKDMLETVLRTRVGLIGTVQNMVGDEILPAGRTTPESYELQGLLRRMADGGCTHVVMEVSSQALARHRVDGITFDTAVFTNLSPDHIGTEEHPDYAHYRDSKKRLFAQCRHGIFNADDPEAEYMMAGSPCEKSTYAIHRPADLRAERVNILKAGDLFGMEFTAAGTTYHIRMPGEYNVYNALAVVALVGRYTDRTCELAEALSYVTVPGRFEVLPDVMPGCTVVLDFAHNSISMNALLQTARSYDPARIIAVFGTGGRTRVRRHQLGEAVAKGADLAIITTDDPDRDDPAEVIADIATCFGPGSCPHVGIVDRREAVRYALEQMRPGDMLLLCGKGREGYQLVQGKKIPYDEEETVRSCARELLESRPQAL